MKRNQPLPPAVGLLCNVVVVAAVAAVAVVAAVAAVVVVAAVAAGGFHFDID